MRYFKIFICIFALFAALTASAESNTAKIGTANTRVYVRDIESNDVVGGLAKGDKVKVIGKIKYGYAEVEIGDKTYKVYEEYLDVADEDLSQTNLIEKPRKSKGESKSPISKKTTHKIRHSVFDGLKFWD